MARRRAPPKRSLSSAPEPDEDSLVQEEDTAPPPPAKRQRATRKPSGGESGSERKGKAAPAKQTTTTTGRRTRAATSGAQEDHEPAQANGTRKRGRPAGARGRTRKAREEEEEEEEEDHANEDEDDQTGDDLGSDTGETRNRRSSGRSYFADVEIRSQPGKRASASSATTKDNGRRKQRTGSGGRKAASTGTVADGDQDEGDTMDYEYDGQDATEHTPRRRRTDEEPSRLVERFQKLQNTPGRRGSSLDASKGSDTAALRRKLGDMTQKYETMESRYRQLREVGVVEANANAEKMKKQCEATATASQSLVDSLKAELDRQQSLATESRSLEKKLAESNGKVTSLTKQLEDMNKSLSSAQNEIKSLQMKLAAARSTVASVESMKVPGSAIKNRGAAASAGADAARAAKLATLKEDLYSDLSGLIIRDVNVNTADSVYDCIQTGLNGTLHFKLSIPNDEDGTLAERDAAEVRYTPLLDQSRDRQLIDILPDYLTVEITFARVNAPMFYRRVVEVLTKKLEEDEDEDEDEEEEEEEEEEE